MHDAFSEVQSISFVDLGCSGSLDEKWSGLFFLLSYVGFDPNAEECERLRSQPHPYQTASYFPYAIAGEEGTRVMHLTRSDRCYSLLRPNHAWLERFSFSNLFEEVGETTVRCTTLGALAREQGIRADIIKLDTQGLELPILRSAGQLLDRTFCVETETGFVDNYVGETTYAQIDEFMRAQGFLLFDLDITRMSRNNALSEHGKHQPLWCEAIWLYDFVGQEKKPSRKQALKALLICQALGFYDYGLELAHYFEDAGIVDRTLLGYLANPSNWRSNAEDSSSTSEVLLKMLPGRFRNRLRRGLENVSG